MKLLELLFLLCTACSTIHGHRDDCPTSNCSTLSISYPFKQEVTKRQNDCAYVDLKCNTDPANGTATVSLPNAGDFYVRYIFYEDPPVIQLYDPGRCLMSRFMKNVDLSKSTLEAFGYQEYSFFTCPSDATIIQANYVLVIDCLSNFTVSTIAVAYEAAQPPVIMLQHGCQLVGSWMIPVSSKGQFDAEGSNGDLYLTWDPAGCEACNGGSKRFGWGMIIAAPFFISSLVTVAILFVMALLRIIKCVVRRNQGDSDSSTDDGLSLSATGTAAPPHATARGLEESKINSCTELVVLTEGIISPVTGFRTCSICLESYHPQELVRSIAKCSHCFHAHCLEAWLVKSRTCPVCRTILSENVL